MSSKHVDHFYTTIKILTVGEGDLSLSLALARAYGSHLEFTKAGKTNQLSQPMDQSSPRNVTLQLTVTTLISSREELLQTYPQSANVLKELAETYQAPVHFGVDATQLHTYPNFAARDDDGFDLITFHHPHLGDYQESLEDVHLQRHHVLLCHYLTSASQCVSCAGRIHVALKDDQVIAWKLNQAATRSRIDLILSLPVQKPFHHVLGLMENELSLNGSTMISASRRSRRAKTASKHWLARYGYAFQRTFPKRGGNADLSGSQHYVFQRKEDAMAVPHGSLQCGCCGLCFERHEQLQRHQQAPALPVQKDAFVKAIQGHMSDASKRNVCDASVEKLRRSSDIGAATYASTSALCTHERAEAPGGSASLTPEGGEEVLVAKEFAGKRLRWFVQHCFQVPSKRSKQNCERWIASGHVQVNGHTALDSGRLLQPGFVVAMSLPAEAKVKASATRIRVVEIWNGACHVVWKSVGMRTVGGFDGTLERAFSNQQGLPYQALSNLDTGCSGLCVMQESACSDDLDNLCHTFTALVHGCVPKAWENGVTVVLPIDSLRRWKKKKDTSETSGTSCNAEALIKMVDLAVSDETGPPNLSTLSISTSCRASGLASVLCFYLRKTAGHPIIGDRFATAEYLSLPRSMKNRLKQRLCVACTAVSTKTQSTTVPVPEKWRASYWQKHCQQSTRIDPFQSSS